MAIMLSAIAKPVHPTAIEPLRTSVVEDPEAIQRSDSLPQIVAPVADMRKSSPPSRAIVVIEKCRPRMR